MQSDEEQIRLLTNTWMTATKAGASEIQEIIVSGDWACMWTKLA